jgi:hypothetical protein
MPEVQKSGALPPPPSGASHRFWTAVEFNQIGDFGYFEGRRAVLIDGVILEWGQMPPPHAVGMELTAAEVRSAFGTGWVVRQRMPLHLSKWTDPMPDIAVIQGDIRDYAETHPAIAALVVEVADTSLEFDQTVKAELYAQAGFADYWVLDLSGRQLLVFRDTHQIAAGKRTYRTLHKLGPTDSVSPLAVPGASIRVADLLP